jgi:filamentous hemagglutinin family protein
MKQIVTIAIVGTMLGWAIPVGAQITPGDGTHTRITQEGDRILIRGGARSRDGANLFHRFERFNLEAGQIADLQTRRSIQNVLGQVTGGDASIIHGQLRVSGSSANLWLINPAGILFGRDARLDVGGSFTATTATHIGFGDRWLSSVDPAPYAALVGDPTALAFSTSAAVINAGRLTVPAGEQLMLAGGVVINTGQLTAPAGQVSIVAVPEQRVVRLGQRGSLLSLELEPLDLDRHPAPGIVPLDVPRLLTDPTLQHASRVTVGPDGTVHLGGSTVTLTGGSAVVSGTIRALGGAAEGGNVTLTGDRVGLFNSQIDVSGRRGGGTVRVGGDYRGQGPLFTSQYTVMDANSQIWANGIRRGDGGRVILWSDDATRAAGQIWAQGGARSGDGGFVEVSGLQTLQFLGQVNTLAANGVAGTLFLDPTNIIVAEVGLPGALVGLDGVDDAADPDSIIGAPGAVANYSQIAPSTIAAATTNVILQATDSIFFNDAVTIPTNGIGLRAEAGNNIEVNAALTTTNGAIALVAGNAVQINQPLTSGGGDISIQAGGIINLFSGIASNGGGVQLNSGTIVNMIAPITSNGGPVAIAAETQLNLNAPLTSNGGTVTLTADQDGDGLGTLGINAEVNTGAGDLILTGSDIALNAAVRGQGTLQLRPSAMNQDISILEGGGTTLPTLNITAADLNAIQAGFTAVTIGRADSQGTLRLGQDWAVATDLTLQAGSIDTRNARLTTEGGVTLSAVNDALTGDILSSGGRIQLEGRQIDTRGGILDSRNPNGAGGAIALSAIDNILTQDINSGGGTIQLRGNGVTPGNLISGGGRIRISGARIDTRGGGLDSTDGTGDGGAIALSATDTLVTGDLTLGGGINPGALTLNAPNTIRLAAPVTANGAAIRIGTTIAPRRLVLPDAITDSGDLDVVVANDFTWRNSTIAPRVNSRLSIQTQGDLRLLGSGTITLNGGPLRILSQGAIQIADGVSITSQPTLGGDVSLTAQDALTTGAIAVGTGDLTITSSAGAVRTGPVGTQGGAIAIAGQMVHLDEISSRGGNVSVTSSGRLTTSGIDAREGTITLDAARDLTVTGDVQTRDRPIQITIGRNLRLEGATLSTSGGLFRLDSPNALRILGQGAIATGGSDLRLIASRLQIADTVELSTRANRSGTLFLQATAGNLTAGPLTTAGGRGGDITTIAQGRLTLGALDASGTQRGGRVTLTSNTQDLTVGTIDTSGPRGGDIILNAITTLTTGGLRSRGTVGNGGAVIIDPVNIVVDWIDAQGGTAGRGGTVDLTASNRIRLTGSIIDDTGLAASIATGGGTGSGNITLRHGGGGLVPFIVGDARTNGSAAVLASRRFTIAPESFLFTYQEGAGAGRIRIVSVSPSAVPDLPPPIGPQPPVNPGEPPILPPINPDPPPSPRSLLTLPEQDPVSSLDIDEIPGATLDTLSDLETLFTEQYVSHLSLPRPEILDLEAIQANLRRASGQTGIQPAIVYAVFTPPMLTATPLEGLDTVDVSRRSPDDRRDRLELVLVTQTGQPVRVIVPDATRDQITAVARQFYLSVTNPDLATTRLYQAPAEQLYRWLIAPIRADLEAQGIQHISFVLDGGLRSLPMAALHSGDRFLIEDYSLGLMPSVSLSDNRPVNLQTLGILAMGASEFTDQDPLPAVPVELQHISATPLLNEDFTIDALRRQRQRSPFGIVHLATHGEFLPGGPDQSYIQFWDERLPLDGFRALGLYDPPVELLVLSACRTALGDAEAELGFAGMAIQAGVNSALASLWTVSDVGTLALMSEFYDRLGTSPTRTEALRQAQRSLLQGAVTLQDQQVVTTRATLPLPSSYQSLEPLNLAHPYYWSAFTIIGNPW